MSRKLALAFAIVSLGFNTGCKSGPDAGATADTIYYGGDVVTINDAQTNAKALAVKNGKVLMVGSRTEIESAHKGQSTVIVDLAGKTPTSGFIDPHSHFTDSLSMLDRVHVSAPP